jgi:chromosome segregation ATPase
MPVPRRKYDDLRTRYEALAEDHEQLTEELAASRRATLRLSGQYTHLMETGEPMPMFSRPSKVQQRIANLERRLRLARKAGARVLAAYVRERRRADLLQARLDDACGLSRTAVTAGEHWQSRREDKPVKEASAS